MGAKRAWWMPALVLLWGQLAVPASAQEGVWVFQATEKISCKPALPPFRRRSVGQGVNTITFFGDGTYRVPRGFSCPATGLPAPDALGTWTRDGNKLVLMEAGLNDVFLECSGVELSLKRYKYRLKVTHGGQRFRGKMLLTGTVGREGLASKYREIEHLTGKLIEGAPVTDVLPVMRRRGRRTVGGAIGGVIDAEAMSALP